MADYRSLVIVSGVTRQIVNGDRIIAPSGVVSAGADLTLEAAATYAINVGTAVATQVNVGSGTAPVSVGGLLYANTMDRATAGALTIGGTNATSISVGKAGVAVTAAGGILTTSVGRSSAGTLAIGTDANTTAITVGAVGVTTTIAGDLQVNGAETIIGLTTFTGDAQFNGNVVFGNAVTDTVAFQSVIGNGTYNDLIFRVGNTHTIKAAAAAAGAGGIGNTMRYLGGDGAAADATTPGGAGGYADFRAGTGGAGSAAQIAGMGNSATLKGGDAGVNGGAGGNSGGNAIVNGGLGTNGTNGQVQIGYTQTSQIYLGPVSGTATPITQQSTSQVTFNGQMFLGLDVTFPNTVDHEIKVNDTATVDTDGKGIWMYAGAAGAASTANALPGGAVELTGGTGGAGSATYTSGPGGNVNIDAGPAGAAAAGGGNYGGNVIVRGGNGTGTVTGGHVYMAGGNGTTDGEVWVGYQNTSLIRLGNTTDNTPISQQGTGNVTFVGPVLCNNNVTLGDGTADTVTVNGEFFYFSNLVDHTVQVVASAATVAGKGIGITAGRGGAGSGATPGGAGGECNLGGAQGGAGTATGLAGAGGAASLVGGWAGTALAGGGAAGGNVTIEAGNSSGAVKGANAIIHAGYSGTGDNGDIVLEYAHDVTITCNNKISLVPTSHIETAAEFRTTSRIRIGESSTPSTVSNNGFLYTKDVAGIAELFWRDDTNVELQVTTNGQLNVTASTSSPKVVFTGTARATISAGAPVCLNYDGANNGVFNADANGTGTGTQRCIGLADAATTATNPAYVVTNGAKATADAIWDAVPATTDVGKPAYLSENVGKLTLTAPSTIGSVVQVVGVISAGGTGNVAVLVQPQAPVLL